MKMFLSIFAAGVLAAVVALLGYDVFVAQPREQRMLERQQVALEAAADAGLAGSREQAAEVASELDASAKRSVAAVREAMAAEASAVELRGRIAEGLARASMVKLAVAESYMNSGIAAPESYAVGAVAAIAMEADGVVAIRYTDLVAPGAQIRLTPTFDAEIGSIDWRCDAEGFPDSGALPLSCR
jgi:hypothetical protein